MIETLPDALLVRVLTHTCDRRSLGRSACVSHRLRELVADGNGACWTLLRPEVRTEGLCQSPAAQQLHCPSDSNARGLALCGAWCLFGGGHNGLQLCQTDEEAQATVPLNNAVTH